MKEKNIIKEKLIKIVRKHECIFNTSDKNYRNYRYKTLLWENIGRTLGIEGSRAHKLWRSLRDSYVRYRKAKKDKTGARRKIVSFKWRSQMAFLDRTLQLRASSTNVTPQKSFNTQRTQSSSPLTQSSRSRHSASMNSSPQLQTNIIDSRNSGNESKPLSLYPKDDSLPKVLFDNDVTATELKPKIMHSEQDSQSIPSQKCDFTVNLRNDALHREQNSSPLLFELCDVTKTSPILPSTCQDENTEKILDYFLNKKKKERDSIDYLFMSYAKSFRNLSMRKQCKVKVELAKLFADTELKEFGNSSTNETPRFSTIMITEDLTSESENTD